MSTNSQSLKFATKVVLLAQTIAADYKAFVARDAATEARCAVLESRLADLEAGKVPIAKMYYLSGRKGG